MESSIAFQQGVPSFNRTNVESKLSVMNLIVVLKPCTFNRTNMESKHLKVKEGSFRVVFLLIAPIWNRNRSHYSQQLLKFQLLIAPVWN